MKLLFFIRWNLSGNISLWIPVSPFSNTIVSSHIVEKYKVTTGLKTFCAEGVEGMKKEEEGIRKISVREITKEKSYLHKLLHYPNKKENFTSKN